MIDDCKHCRHFRPDQVEPETVEIGRCDRLEQRGPLCGNERRNGLCGPSARYWDPGPVPPLRWVWAAVAVVVMLIILGVTI